MTLTTIEIDKEQSLIRLALVQLGANYPRTVASLIWRLSSEVIRRLKAVNLSPVELERLIGLLPEANRAPLSSASGAADVFAAASMHVALPVRPSLVLDVRQNFGELFELTR